MADGRSALQELSKYVFGQVHRLAVMVAIAESASGRVTPTDLATQLGLAQSALQAPLRDLEEAGLLTRQTGAGRRNVYVRQESHAWSFALEQRDRAVELEKMSPVRSLQSS